MTKPTTPPNPFNWRGPSQVLDNFGRVKSAEQIKKDATSTSKYSDSGRSTGPTNSSLAPR